MMTQYKTMPAHNKHSWWRPGVCFTNGGLGVKPGYRHIFWLAIARI